jgi:23S rRNA (guanine745-N1)-methyltransferase
MTALGDVVPVLRCPVCAQGVHLESGQVRCQQGHGYDIARQGYVNLVTGRRGPGTGDTAEMIAARDRWLTAGHYVPIAAALAGLVQDFVPQEPAPIVESGGGTGYYLAHVLEELGDRAGICIDLSVPALRRAARAHPRLAAIGADAWQPLPFADASLSGVLSVFAPRNLPEIARCLVPGGVFAVITPQPEHLAEVAGALGMIGIAPEKQERLDAQLEQFERAADRHVSFRLSLLHDQLADLVRMGPSAHHLTAADLATRLTQLPEPASLTVSVRISAHARL